MYLRFLNLVYELSCIKERFSRCQNIIRANLTSRWHLQDLLPRYVKEIFWQTNWTRYIRRFSFVFELCWLCKGFPRYLKGMFKNWHQQSKKKSSTYINYGNEETQTQKSLIPTHRSLIPTQTTDRFQHKCYKGRWILKLEFVFTINNGDCDARWSMSFCFPKRMDNLRGMNQTKYLIKPTIMIITILRIKNKS